MSYDVIVVGARIAGSSTSMLLARAELRGFLRPARSRPR
jgi:flavin-dependent dehydrogenase